VPFVQTQSSRGQYTIACSDDSLGAADLEPHERREYAALPHNARRTDWLAGREAAKRAIATHCDVPKGRVCLIARPDAAPIALMQNDDASWSALPLSLSISHHDGRGLAAVADSPARVGVDLARAGEIEREHHRYFLAPSERAVAERGGATLVWALKEAAWKALSLNAATPLTALELAIDETRGLRGLRLDGCWIPATARTWSLSRDIVAAAVYVGAELQ
jgi:4'-phosphopantetheinyl transferase EntD